MSTHLDSVHDPVSNPPPAADTPTRSISPRLRWIVLLGGGLVVLLLLAWLCHYLLVGRYLQHTNNAYLKADAVAIAPRVNGYITQVLVEDNQWVKAGQPLLQIDPRTYQAQADQVDALVAVRQSDIAAAQATVQGSTAQLAQVRAQLLAARASLNLARAEVARFTPLAATGADTVEHLESLQHDLERAKAQYDAAQAQVKAAQSQSGAAEAQLGQAQAGLKQAQADAAAARLALDDTRLTARIDGRIGNKTVQVGQFVAAGTRTMTLMPVAELYLEANFKETQLGLMRPGQTAEISVDALPGDKLKGTVESIAPGTGSQFALLPPENATGNFTKVVQRIPVRIRVQADAQARQVLVPGMSAEVSIDTRTARREQAAEDGVER